MKRVCFIRACFFVVFSLCVLFSPGVYAADGLTKIANNVYSYVDIKGAAPKNSFGANAGIIIGKNGIIVVDTLISSKEALRFIKDIRKISDKPIKYVVNTHWHLDHAFGNSEFEKLGAIVISHAADKANLLAGGEATLKNAKAYGLSQDDVAGTKIAYPVLSFTDRMQIDLGDQKVDLIYLGPSHTGGSVAVYLPDKKVLFAGDILFTKYHPFIIEGNIEGWVKALDAISALDVEKIIPGHGPVSDKRDIKDMKDYLIVFDKKATELAAQSSDVAYITSEIKKAVPLREELESVVQSNIQMKYMRKEK